MRKVMGGKSMKKNGKSWLRIAALCLVAVLLMSTVSASTYTLDLSGDGKVNVWDVQVAVNDGIDDRHLTADAHRCVASLL